MFLNNISLLNSVLISFWNLCVELNKKKVHPKKKEKSIDSFY